MTALHQPELVEKTCSGVFYFTDERLFETTGVRLAFTGRAGGVSKAPFDGLNLGSHVGDDIACVEENRRLALAALGAPSTTSLITLNQVHGVKVVRLTGGTPEAIAQASAEGKAGADAIAVAPQVENLAALLCFADCVPLAFVAPDGTFALAHAGWRGVMAEIGRVALLRVCELAGSLDPARVNVYLGPHIHAECFEVSAELATTFREKFGEAVTPDARHVDLTRAIRATLVSAGASEARIADVGVCTVCNHDRFFSYRASGGECGRHAAIAFRGGTGA